MICQHCANRDHVLCRACPCQHAGTCVPYLDKDARHALVLDPAGRIPADLVTIRSNGQGDHDG